MKQYISVKYYEHVWYINSEDGDLTNLFTDERYLILYDQQRGK